MNHAIDLLESLAIEVRDEFQRARPMMSFDEYIELFLHNPLRHSRNAVQYVRDCFDHFGTSQVSEVWGEVDRSNIFNGVGELEGKRVVGQERAQQAVYRILDNFVREGRINKLVLLHGPNGSAKSTFINAIINGLEEYSRADEGAMYRFNWIFPNDRVVKDSNIGFSGFSIKTLEASKLATFAHLKEDEIDAKIPSYLYEPPLLLLPLKQRESLLDKTLDLNEQSEAKEGGEPSFVLSDYIRHGQLSHTSRQIYDALMKAYGGDLSKVLKHVQVERFYISGRYRRGAVTVEPQMRVDASLRQITVDRSFSALPSSLQNQTLFEPFGDLVDANRGILEYDDLFKRHPDFNKYLLATSEKGTVALENRILHLDLVLMATGNEMYLEAFKQSPEYGSFKGRVELVRLPYLVNYLREEEIYRDQISNLSDLQHIAPYATRVAALWAILSRLKRPDPDLYETSVREIVSRLTPIEKAELYASGKVPSSVAPDRGQELRDLVFDLMSEGEDSGNYEGRTGASAREMKVLLFNASQNPDYDFLSPHAVIEEMTALVKDRSVYPFLQNKPDGAYQDYGAFVERVKERYLDWIDYDVRRAMGLVDERQYGELFARYVEHVGQLFKGEDVYNPTTGTYEPADEKFLAETEALLGIGDVEPKEFRQSLISSIAAYSIDNPGVKVDYEVVFPNLFDAMMRSFYEERIKTVQKILEDVLTWFSDGPKKLNSSQLRPVEETVKRLKEEFGFNNESAQEAVAFLLVSRYKA
jgi:predicted Ser/Thr protein kinase